MTALPSLHGSVGYIFTSCNLNIQGSGTVRIKDMVERFTVFEQPRRPEGKEEEWLAGERIDKRGKYVSCLQNARLSHSDMQTTCYTAEYTFRLDGWTRYTRRVSHPRFKPQFQQSRILTIACTPASVRALGCLPAPSCSVCSMILGAGAPSTLTVSRTGCGASGVYTTSAKSVHHRQSLR